MDNMFSPKNILKSSVMKFPKFEICKETSFHILREGLKDADLVNMLLDMQSIRNFENKIGEIKRTGKYKDIDVANNGPIHLINGGEAACVGQAYALMNRDYSLGSHRSHGELLARAFMAIRRNSIEDLQETLVNYENRAIFEVIKGNASKQLSLREQIKLYIYYGSLSEIFGKMTGFQRGYAGSMNLFFHPFGVFPSNAIVGGSAPIATGSALFKFISNDKSVAVANLGDGAVGCGVVYEAMNFSNMKQFHKEWEKKKGLPIIFSFFNNGYGMGGKTYNEIMGQDLLVRIAAGINEVGMYAQRVNGMNPLAVYYATKQAREIALKEGPVLLDQVIYRYSNHSEGSSKDFRSLKEIEEWKGIDPIKTFKDFLISKELLIDMEYDSLVSKDVELLDLALDLVFSEEKSPREIFSRIVKGDEHDSVKIAKEITNNSIIISRDSDNFEEEPSSFKAESIDRSNETEFHSIRSALASSIRDAMKRKNNLIHYGVVARDLGGTNQVNKPDVKALPIENVFNTPVSEACLVSVALGYAMCGGSAIVDLMYSGFLGRAGDELFNQLSKWREISGKAFKLPVIIRLNTSRSYGAQHSNDLASLVCHVPGFNVIYPVTPYDVKGLFNAAINSDTPTILFENRELYSREGIVQEIPLDYYECEIGRPKIYANGESITILSIGAVLYEVIEARKELMRENISLEIIDARSLVPFDYNLVIESVKKTKRILIIGSEYERASILTEFAYQISQKAFKFLDMPPVIMGAANHITPSYENLGDYLPNKENIVKKIRNILNS